MRDRINLHLYKCKKNFREIFTERIGIVKEIDELGRLHIPKEIRKRLGLGKEVELVVTQDGLLIRNDEYKLIKINEK